MSLGKKLIQASAGVGGAVITDPNFSDTTLLLQGDTSNESMSYNAFGDASTNAHDITPVGDVHGTPFSPYNESWSVEFDGAGDYLEVAHDSSFTLDGEFTVEMWVNFTSQSQAYWDSIVSIGEDASGTVVSGNGLTIYHSNGSSGSVDGGIVFMVGDVSADRVLSSTVVRGTGWRHIAGTRDSSNVCRLFIDGVEEGTAITQPDSVDSTEFGVRVGLGNTTESNFYDGYVSNFRLVKGTALYTSNFTPSTTPLTDVSGTSLLTCNANRFIDTSSNDHTITVNGDPEIKGFSPFADTDTVTGSGYFDGSGDVLSLADSASWNLGSTFTIEAWIYPTSVSSYNTIVAQGASGWYFSLNGATLQLYDFTTTIAVNSASSSITINEWNHVAVSCNSGTAQIYINGVASGSSQSGVSIADYSATLQIGRQNTLYDFDGYISNLRLVKGTAVYTSAFTPPTSPLTAVSGTSLLTLQNRGANRNIGFIDSSHPTRQITRNGNVTQGSFSPFSQDEGKWGNYFDGSSDWLTIPYSASFDVGSADFCFDMWFYPTTVSNFDKIFTWSSPSTGFELDIRNGGELRISLGTGSSWVYDAVNTGAVIVANEWQHIAWVRSSGTMSVYVNGTRYYSVGDSTNVGNPNTGYSIGAYRSTSTEIEGYLSNFRFVNGSGVYDPTQASITVPTEPLTAVTNTEILTCQSNRFVDNSSNAHSITVNGDPEVTPFSPFAPSTVYDPATKGGSALFADDGANKYLQAAAGSEFNFGTGDFTVECWYYHLPKTTSATDRRYLIHTEESWNGTRWILYTSYSSYVNKFIFYTWEDYVSNSNTPMLVSTSDLVLNQWHHLALTRSGNTFRIFINGVLEDSSTRYTGSVGADTYPTYIGGGSVQTNRMLSGIVSNARIVKGTALYTSNFTPPTALLTEVSGTSLLCNFTNAGIYDGTGRNVLETVGDAHVENSVKKYGTGSMEFGGNGDYLDIPTNHLVDDFGAGDFTIEGWAYLKSDPASSYHSLFHTGFSLQIYINDSTVKMWASNDGSSYNIVSGLTGPTSAVSQNTWFHWAVVRNGSSFKVYVNGVVGNSGTSSDSIYYDGTPRIADYAPNTGTYPFDGYMDDFRITKGVARYTANFTPPEAKLPNL